MSMRWIVLAATCLLACHCPYDTRGEQPQTPAPATGIDACTVAQPDPTLLPHTNLPPGIALIEQPRGYVGEQLFDLINGGAVQYFDHGFVWALAGTYESERGTRITVELYRMGSPENARALFEARDVPSAERVEAGDGARYIAGSLEMLHRCCVLTVTSFEPSDAGRQTVITLGKRIDEELRR